MIQDNLFNYKRFVFLKWALLLTLISSFAYLFDQPRINANGGTWLGYTLGTIGALLILWLMWFGVRKRQYANEKGNLRGWVSAHICWGWPCRWWPHCTPVFKLAGTYIPWLMC